MVLVILAIPMSVAQPHLCCCIIRQNLEYALNSTLMREIDGQETDAARLEGLGGPTPIHPPRGARNLFWAVSY